MIITSLIENTSAVGLPVEHGLSLLVRLDDGRRLLFDMGQGRLFSENAARLGLDVADVDAAVVSHGHYDHGGGLGTFLELNSKAKVYIHRDAFLPHYSLRDEGLTYIGLDRALQEHERIVLCSDQSVVSDGVKLFADVYGDCCRPTGNRLLFGPSETVQDSFSHEQNLLIEEGEHLVLIAGCAHNGIVNILRKAETICGRKPTHVLAGMHLVKNGLCDEDLEIFIAQLAGELKLYPGCQFFTMHCTGEEQFLRLKAIMGDQIQYLSCGESVVI